jgi:hypothetical protein
LIYTKKEVSDVEIAGAQADVDLMGLIADAKACYIEVTAGEGDLKVNGAATALPISSTGGYWVWFSPDGGLTTLTVTTAADAKFRRYLFS